MDMEIKISQSIYIFFWLAHWQISFFIKSEVFFNKPETLHAQASGRNNPPAEH